MKYEIGLLALSVAALSLVGCRHKTEAAPVVSRVPSPPAVEAVNPADEVYSRQLVGVWKGTVPSPSGHADKDSYEEYRADGTVTESLISPDLPPVRFEGRYRVKGGKLIVSLSGSSAAFGGQENAADFTVTGQQLRIGNNMWYRQPNGTVVPNAPEAFGGRSRPGDQARPYAQPPAQQPPINGTVPGPGLANGQPAPMDTQPSNGMQPAPTTGP